MKVLIIPGLRDHVQAHWQTILAAKLSHAVTIAPMGRNALSCSDRVHAIEKQVAQCPLPVIVVAHSAGCLMLAHWAKTTKLAHKVKGALLAVPPDFETPMPEGYPTMQALEQAGWFPVPKQTLPFSSLVAVSHNDPLCQLSKALALASCWGSEVVDLGRVGHLNPASNFGEWAQAESLIERLAC
jgi:predicted alpha/beta hydrolase family esterase